MNNDFVFVEGGEVTRPHSNSNNQNQNNQFVNSFYISKFQVKQSLYYEITQNNLSNFKNNDSPVEMVTWVDAIKFCNTFSTQNHLQPYYHINKLIVIGHNESNGFRLPTEIEWEFAASGGNLSHGFIYSGSNDLNSVGWFKNNSNSITHPVGYKSPNELEIYDMSGNVWEWCFDHDSNSNTRIYKGGSFLDFDYGCTIATRGHRPPDIRQIDIGFRLVQNITSYHNGR